MTSFSLFIIVNQTWKFAWNYVFNQTRPCSFVSTCLFCRGVNFSDIHTEKFLINWGKKWIRGHQKASFFILFDTFYPKNHLFSLTKIIYFPWQKIIYFPWQNLLFNLKKSFILPEKIIYFTWKKNIYFTQFFRKKYTSVILSILFR